MVASLGQANSTPLLLPTVQGEMLPGFGNRSNLPNLRSQLLISVRGENRAFFSGVKTASPVLLRLMPGIFEPNLLYDHSRGILHQELFGSWSGVIFRSVSPRYARPADIISGYGSYCAGGRWNAPGIYAIYGSIEPGLAADESFTFYFSTSDGRTAIYHHAWWLESGSLYKRSWTSQIQQMSRTN